MGGDFSLWRGMNKLSVNERTPRCNLVLQLIVSIYKTNNLQKEKGFPRFVRMMEFQWSKFLQLKPRNAVNVQKFISKFHSQIGKYVEMISTSQVELKQGGKLKHAVAMCLRRWIPRVKVNAVFHPSEGDQLSTRNSWKPWEVNGKKETVFSQWLCILETAEPHP